MKPYIICHMLSSVDGKIDGAALGAVMDEAEYEATAAKLNGDAWICGRTTMQQHFAEDEPFVSASNTPAGPRPVFIARRATSYAISVDTLGKLRWPDGDLGAKHLICVVSEQVPEDYLAMLREKGISYIVSGKSSVDLANAVNQLGEHFGIRTLLLEGGGHINGAFMGLLFAGKGMQPPLQQSFLATSSCALNARTLSEIASASASEGGFSSRASLLRPPATLQLKLAFVI
jgi:2,5-diamino-6-(ribosylamino)-4(3H)-pyrimidinone 5'-phosphate reductase